MSYVYIFFFQTIFPYRLLQNTEYSSLCYTVGICWLCFMYIFTEHLLSSTCVPGTVLSDTVVTHSKRLTVSGAVSTHLC